MSLPTKTRPKIPPLPGKHFETIFAMQKDPPQYAFLIEKIDADVFEMSTIVLDAKGNRTEYVSHCSAQALILLSQGIATVLYDHNKVKHLTKDEPTQFGL